MAKKTKFRKRRYRRGRKKAVTPSQVKAIVNNMHPTRSDIFQTTASLSTTPSTINNICNMQFNDDASVFGSRQTTKVKLMSFRWDGQVEVSGLATDNELKIMLVKKIADDGAAFDARKCFLFNPGTVGQYRQAQINKRYCKVVFSRYFLLQNQDPSLLTNERYPTLPWKRHLVINYKFKERSPAKYPQVANATVIQPHNHQYYLIGVSDSLVNTPTIDGQGCTFFKNC